jgi:uncharacterized membrane protein
MTTRRLYIAFVSAALAWAALIVVAPFLASRAHASTLGSALTLAVYAAGSAVCHQLPERSFHLWTAQMPVCARCSGIYFGAAALAIVAEGARRLQPSERRSPERRALHRSRLVLSTAVLPTAATLVFEWTTGVTPANWIRFAAGLPIGVAVAWLVRAAAENQVN